jgi:hypothetical protein
MIKLSSYFYSFILKWEGNYTTIDGGTNKGVRWETYKSLSEKLINKKPTQANFKALSDQEAKKFIDHYFYISGAYKLNSQNVAEWLTNFYWGSGGWAVSILIKVLNIYYQAGIKDKGKNSYLNDQIATEVNSIKDQRKLFKRLVDGQKAYYIRLVKAKPEKAQYLLGWNNRINEFYDHKAETSTESKIEVWPVLVGLGLAWYISRD